MSSEEFSELKELFSEFPEAKLTVRDRVPTNMMLLYTILNLNKTIKDIKYSQDEIREAMLALVAMIPDELRDDRFLEEIKEATKRVIIDVRPEFCGVKASVEHCERYGIPTFVEIEQFDYFALYHAVHNLLQRKNISFRSQPKEIMTGKPAIDGEIPEMEDSEA